MNTHENLCKRLKTALSVFLMTAVNCSPFLALFANCVPIGKLQLIYKLIPISNDTVSIRSMGCCRGYIQQDISNTGYILQDIQTRDFLMAFPITTMTTVYCNNNTGDIQ